MIDVVVDDDIDFEPPEHIESAVCAACTSAGISTQDIDACVRFASDQTLQSLNHQWRGKDSVTDVLSFPMQEAPFDPAEGLGDIALAVPFIIHEANRLKLNTADHCLHLIIHATLHLLGFDHISDNDAAHMQQLEQQAMRGMGLHNPYPELELDSQATERMEAP